MFAICRSFGLDRAHRLEVATTLLNREVTSYRDLSPAEWARLHDAFHGAVLVCTIQMERRAGTRR